MTDYNKNNASELLTLLLDGELDQAEHAALLEELSADSLLQAEKQELEAISEAVKLDPEMFIAPPDDATDAVFKTLGFKSPVEQDRKIIPPPPMPTATPLWKKALLPSALLLIALLSVVYFTDFGSNGDVTKQAGAVKEKQEESGDAKQQGEESNSLTEENSITSSTIETESSSASESRIIRNNTSSASNKLITDLTAFENKESVGAADELLAAPEQSSETAVPESQNLLSANNAVIESSEIANSNYFQIDDSYPDLRLISQRNMDNLNSARFRNWELSVRYLAGSSPALQAFYPAEGNILPLNNVALGLLLGISRDFSIGVEAGQEDYKRLVTDDNNNLITAERAALWITPVISWEINQLAVAGFRPVLQTGIGGSTEGFMFRGLVGIRYSSEDVSLLGLKPSLMIGYEGSMLGYKAPDANFYFPVKNGFTLGINFNF